MTYKDLSSAVKVIRRQLPLVAGGVGAVTCLAAFLLNRSVLSAFLALALGLIIATITGFTLKQGSLNSSLQMVFLGVDYLLKVVLVITTLLVARRVEALDQHVLGISLAVSILVQSYIQARILTRIQAPILTPPQASENLGYQTETD